MRGFTPENLAWAAATALFGCFFIYLHIRENNSRNAASTPPAVAVVVTA